MRNTERTLAYAHTTKEEIQKDYVEVSESEEERQRPKINYIQWKLYENGVIKNKMQRQLGKEQELIYAND